MVAKYYILGLTLSTPSLVYFFLSRILRNFLVAAANCIHSSFSLFLRENLRTRIGETVGDGVIALFLACFIQSWQLAGWERRVSGEGTSVDIIGVTETVAGKKAGV